MTIEEALKILDIVKCDSLRYCRKLTYTPTPQDVGRAIEVVENYIENMQKNH